MRWQLQLLKGAIKAAVPLKPTLRRIKRGAFKYPPNVGNLDATLVDAFELIRLLREVGRDIADRTVLEIGSGWFPVIPILYAALGARRVVLSDLRRYMDDSTFLVARDYVRRNADRVAVGLDIEPDRLADMLDNAHSPEDLRFDYRVPFDAAREAPGSIDIVTSRTVLEHIPADKLPTLLAEWSRLLTADGVMVHAIDMSDHFEHNDKTITRINFLRFSAGVWSLVNRISDYQNRLRHSDFLSLFASSGLQVLKPETRIDDRTRADVLRLHLAPPFDRMKPDDIATLTSYVALKPLATGGAPMSRSKPRAPRE